MEIKDDLQFAWRHYEQSLKGVIAYAIDDYGSIKLFNTCPIYGAHGQGRAQWKPSCQGEFVEVGKTDVGPDYSGSGSLIVRKGWEALAELQKQLHMEAAHPDRRAPIPHWKDIKAPEPVVAPITMSASLAMGDLGLSSSVSSDPVDAILANVKSEVQWATRKFASNKQMLAVLMEEVGELAQALLKHDYSQTNARGVYLEAVQVAAMAIQIARSGSAEFTYAFQPLFPELLHETRYLTKE